jgi:hypothetical protein
LTVRDVKDYLASKGILVRPCEPRMLEYGRAP